PFAFDYCVLTGRPNTVLRFLRLKVNVHWLLIGPSEEIEPFVDGVFPVRPQATKDQQSRPGSADFRGAARISCGRRRGASHLDHSGDHQTGEDEDAGKEQQGENNVGNSERLQFRTSPLSLCRACPTFARTSGLTSAPCDG